MDPGIAKKRKKKLSLGCCVFSLFEDALNGRSSRNGLFLAVSRFHRWPPTILPDCEHTIWALIFFFHLFIEQHPHLISFEQ